MSRRSKEAMLLLKEALKIEFPTFVLTEGDSSGDPILQVAEDATPATTEEVAFVKIIQKTYTGFPTPSLASADDGRAHVIQLVLEESAVADVSVWKSLDLSRLIARLKDVNMDIEVYLKGLGAIPAEADIIAGNFQGEIRVDVRHPNIGQ